MTPFNTRQARGEHRQRLKGRRGRAYHCVIRVAPYVSGKTAWPGDARDIEANGGHSGCRATHALERNGWSRLCRGSLSSRASHAWRLLPLALALALALASSTEDTTRARAEVACLAPGKDAGRRRANGDIAFQMAHKADAATEQHDKKRGDGDIIARGKGKRASNQVRHGRRWK
jgi:hypothetical protein